MKYEVVIGLEVHTQLKTLSKLFCSCSTQFGSSANQNTCPICLGMPGVLPVLNKHAVDLAIRACLATHCKVAPVNQFDRKNYFYPDLPKGYQVSQFSLPIGEKGYVDIFTNSEKKRIGLTRIHMEEDAGKLIHGENLGNPDKSYVDFNRTGVPLVEIVSEPELRSPEEARDYLTELKAIIQYADASDCNMEEGSFRCDANVSLRPFGQKELGTRTELKNINSFKFVQKAIYYEIERQSKLLDQGDRVIQETRLYDSNRGVTYTMRSKEEAHDYRYFPEPDLTPIVIDSEWVERINKTLPELPEEKRNRFSKEFDIPAYDAQVLTTQKELADYFEECVRLFKHPKMLSNWIMGELMRELKNNNHDIKECPVSPKNLTDLLKEIETGKISGKIGKGVFEEMYSSQKTAQAIIEEKGLSQISDESSIGGMVDEVIAQFPEQVAQFQSGKEKVLGFLVGQVMKASQGKANPALLNKLLREKIKA